MFALDTNLLVYAHNRGSRFHDAAAQFVQRVMTERDDATKLLVCLPSQVLMEFLHVITSQRLESPLPLHDALDIVQDYLSTGIRVVHPRETQIQTSLDILRAMKSRAKIFDVAIAATLRDNGIEGFFTLNTDDFKDFDFLKVTNPLK